MLVPECRGIFSVIDCSRTIAVNAVKERAELRARQAEV